MPEEKNIESILQENRKFSPPADFISKANLNKAKYEELNKLAESDYEAFWNKLAEENITWFKKWDKTLDWNPPFSKWFLGGKLNVSYNCLDRHLKDRGNKKAIIWVAENGEKKELTYSELHKEVCKFSNVLIDLGVKEKDRVVIYMPLVIESVVAMLACARIGAIHSVVFGGFSKEALADRINNAKAKMVITADGGFRRGETVPLKKNVDKALEKCSTVEKVVVVRSVNNNPSIVTGRDFWYYQLMSQASENHEAPQLDSEHPLFTLYTSGTTGKPKGILHSTAGYLLWATQTCKWVFDLKEDDIYWCTADIGWITGHSYVTYGPLSCGATILLYEGAPNYPDWGRFWEVIEQNKVSIFYTAPTAIRAFMKAGDEFVEKYDLSSLRLLGTVGEPINPEAWMWYHKKIGNENCPIVDTWWQTETGGIMLSPLPGVTETKPGSATFPLPGVMADIVDESGQSMGKNEGGFLTITKPWPSMLRTVYGDDNRYKETYWSQVEGSFFAGDGARKDDDGYFWILGRVDDVINISGHRLSTMEVESALVSHPAVAEAAVVGYPHDVKGEALCAFVIKLSSYDKLSDEELKKELRDHVAKEIGPIAKPDQIKFTDNVPKTRSGKIMRRLLRDIASGKETKGDTSTLENSNILDDLRKD